MLPSGPKSRIAPGFFRPAPRLRLGALVRVPPAPFLRPRRTVRGLPACCSWRQSWGSARFGTTVLHSDLRRSDSLQLSPKRPVVSALWLAPECRAGRPCDLRRSAGFPGRQHVPVPRSCPAKLYSPSVAATGWIAPIDRGGASPLRSCAGLLPDLCDCAAFTASLAFSRFGRFVVAILTHRSVRATRAPQGFALPPGPCRPPNIAVEKWPLLPWACR